MKEMAQRMADHFGLTEDERQRILPSGQQSYINNRVGWAKSYLKKAGLVENPSRGKVRITNEGRSVLAEAPASINCEYLMKYPSFVEFWRQKRKPTPSTNGDLLVKASDDDRTPDEAIESAYEEIRNALADDLLEQVLNCNPTFFERMVLDLLIAMGYGGALPESGTHLGK